VSRWALTVDIFEPEGAGTEYPVVRHVFFGKTQREAEHYLESHLKSDAFLRACMSGRGYRGIVCNVATTMERVR
jgi:hypothetical protein